MTKKPEKQNDIVSALPSAENIVGGQHPAAAGTTDNGTTAPAPQSTELIRDTRSAYPVDIGISAAMPQQRSLKIEAAKAADPFFSGRKHYPALDGLRALAIIGVICLHFGDHVKHYQLVPGGALALGLFKVFRHGAWGVDLFFVLSGYLITGILLESRGQRHYFRNFYARRTLRIFPLYYGVLLCLLVLLPLALSHVPALLAVAYHRQAWLWTYTANVKIAMSGLVLGDFGHFWTLAIEEQFYLFWPLLIFLIPRKRLLGVVVALIIIINIARVLFWAAGHGQEVWNHLFYLTPFRADTLLAGAALAVLQFEGRLGDFRRLFAIAFACVLPVILVFYFGTSRGLRWVPNLMMPHLTFAPILFGSALGFILTSHPGSRLLKALSFRPLRAIGKYSYAMYVFHFIYMPIQERYLPFSLFAALLHSVLFGLLAYYVSAVGIAFCLAFCSYHLYEKHFLKLKKYFPEKTSARVAEPSTASAA